MNNQWNELCAAGPKPSHKLSIIGKGENLEITTMYKSNGFNLLYCRFSIPSHIFNDETQQSSSI